MSTKVLALFFRRETHEAELPFQSLQNMRNILAYTNTHTRRDLQHLTGTTRDQIKDCLLFCEWLKDSKQALNACHTVCLLQECCAGLTHQLEAGVHHRLTTRFKNHAWVYG